MHLLWFFRPSYIEMQRFPLRSQVQECNRRRLRELPGPSVTYQAMDSAGYDVDGNRIPREQAFRLLDRLIALNEITVKVGMKASCVTGTDEISHFRSELRSCCCL